MLNPISWQQYFAAILLLSAAWYSYIGLRYYRNELAAMLKIKPAVQTITPPVAGKLSVVMGEAKPEIDTHICFAEDLVFSGTVPDEISDQTIPAGPADKLLAEAKVLMQGFSENDDKTGFLSIFKTLLAGYAIDSAQINLPEIAGSLCEFAASRLPFPLETNDLLNL